MDLVVAALAKRHEVVLRVGAATADRYDMMYFLHGCDPAFLQALFTQGVSCHVSGADSMPRSAVLTGGVGCSLISVVLLTCVFPMLLTVLTVG